MECEWDLNDAASEEDGGCGGEDEKGKAAGVTSAEDDDSSSSVVVVAVEACGEREADGSAGRLFGFSISGRRGESSYAESEAAAVTHQFFPFDDVDGSRAAYSSGVRLRHSLEPAVAGMAPDALPPVKKSRRGPRSRSSQYRGVTFYRRTGRWESHIW